MGTKDPRVDAYIAKQKDFTQPILARIREIAHEACPDVAETIKWSAPGFVYAGQTLFMMAGFKEYAGLAFTKAKLLPELRASKYSGGESAGHFGKLKSVKDLPSKAELTKLIKAAMKLNADGVKVPRAKTIKPALPVPAELTAALGKDKKAKAAFDGFPPGHRREYCEWIGGAKRPETRTARVAQAIEWISEGRSRNWKYQQKK